MTALAVGTAAAVSVTLDTVALLPAVAITPSGLQLTTPWRAVTGATGARVASAVLTVDPVTHGSGRDVGTVSPGATGVQTLTVRPPDPAVPTRALTIPGLPAVLDANPALRVVVQQGGQPVVAVPPLPGNGQLLPAQLTGGSRSGAQVTVPDLLGTLTVSVALGSTLQDLVKQPFTHQDVRLRVAPMPVGVHVLGPDGDEQLAVPGPVRARITHDLAPALQRHLTAAVTAAPGGTAPITVRSDAQGEARLQLRVDGVVIERTLDGRLTVECDGAPTTVARPGPPPGRPPTRTVADVTITHHGAAIHPASDPVPAVDADTAGLAVRDAPVVRRIAAATLAGERVARVAVVGWPHGETDLALVVAGRSLTRTALPAADGRTPARVVWFDLGEPAAVEGPLELSLRATRGAFRWLAAPEPACRIAVATAPEGTHVTVGGTTVALTGAETHVPAAVLDGVDGWVVATDQLCAVALSGAVMEFAP
ncbi:hypothetical protein [Cellulomonas xylanilytica]|uniref:Uncharacterized protein n=1 Tax=Cellulomonas xylanilytica TaxID=233583 RepID=A0A510V2H8_9CELL|nr:hypothetical protein [Cellulomonas xylanilytica]GEK21069.1 hypothetical protein CXY01_15890 [Cellulomonas xylanilytica]